MRFSLRAMLIGLAFVALFLAWLGYHLNWIRERRIARQWLEAHSAGGAISHTPEYRPPLPWSLRILGEEPLPIWFIQNTKSERAYGLRDDYRNGSENATRLFPECQFVDTNAEDWTWQIDDEDRNELIKFLQSPEEP